MNKTLISLALLPALLVPAIGHAEFRSLDGRILIQVESRGEAWYVDPKDSKRHYLGRPDDAFNVMKRLGLGIAHKELSGYLKQGFPKRLSGKILLDVQSRGEAYYIYPADLKGYYLGRPADAFRAMKDKGLGITDADLARIAPADSQVAMIKSDGRPAAAVIIPAVTQSAYSAIEQQVFDLINERRRAIGAAALGWNERIAQEARNHSFNMSTGEVPTGHDGFRTRADSLMSAIDSAVSVGENVAWNKNYPDPGKTAVAGWIESQGHRENLENAAYDLTGIGVAKSQDGGYYLTQLFIKIR